MASFASGQAHSCAGYRQGGRNADHLPHPPERRDKTGFAETLEVPPERDEHSSSDVLDRLKSL